MGLFGMSKEIKIYEKAQKGILQGRIFKKNQNSSEKCMIQLDKDSKGDYKIIIKTNDEEFQITLV